MANILTLRNLKLSYGEQILLDNAELTINEHETISLLGRNGEGKSTLLKVIAKIIQVDEGEYNLAGNNSIAYMPQEIPENIEGNVLSVISSGIENLAKIVADFNEATDLTMVDPSEKNLNKLAKAQQEMDDNDAWTFDQQVQKIISQLSLNADDMFNKLSGGVKRRVILGRELIKKPDLLLLDEPTNHLDIVNIDWLEKFIKSLDCTVLLITHDRRFMQNVATRILELDRGTITSWPYDYENYLRRKAERDNAEEKANARFDKKLSQEEVWIRQGVKARRTRNEGRVRKLKEMRQQLQQRRTVKGKVNLQLQNFDNSGKIVVEAENITHSFKNKPIVKDFNLHISRGNKIGIIGENGCGKTTLLNILLGKLEPEEGTVKLGTNLQIAYFDQLNNFLDLEKTLQENIGDGSDNIMINGALKHITSYLQDFLFPPQKIRQPVKSLSGGERNRAMLAKLFSQPANLLILDEPTNDLDIETLDLLEELLINYDGTIILVSHDRNFLDNVVTSSIIFETDGNVYENIGGYSDWQAIRSQFVTEEKPKKNKNSLPKSTVKPSNSKKLSFKDQQELDKLPKLIENAEMKISQLQKEISDPEFYQQDTDKINKTNKDLSTVESELELLYEKWEQLET